MESELWKKFETEDIILYNPFDWKEIRLVVGSKEHAEFLSHPFNKSLLSFGEETKQKYSEEHIELGQKIFDVLKKEFQFPNPTFMFNHDGSEIFFGIGVDTKERYKVSIIKVERPDEMDHVEVDTLKKDNEDKEWV